MFRMPGPLVRIAPQILDLGPFRGLVLGHLHTNTIHEAAQLFELNILVDSERFITILLERGVQDRHGLIESDFVRGPGNVAGIAVLVRVNDDVRLETVDGLGLLEQCEGLGSKQIGILGVHGVIGEEAVVTPSNLQTEADYQ